MFSLGKPNYPVPAKRTPQWISAFEKMVSEFQEKIKKIERSEQAYNICKNVIDQCKLKNDIKLKVRDCGDITIELPILATDKKNVYEPLLREIGNALFTAKLHRSGTPSNHSLYAMATHYSWAIGSSASELFYINAMVEIGMEGTLDFEVQRVPHEITYTTTLYNLVPRTTFIENDAL